MESVINAINDLKGDLSNCYNQYNGGNFLFKDIDDGEYITCDTVVGNDACLRYVCSKFEFLSTVQSLSMGEVIK